jgi:hypothetical protein
MKQHRPDATAPPAPTEQNTQAIDYVRWTSQLRAELAATLGGVLLRGARAIQVGVSPGTKRPLTAPGTLLGYSLRNIDAGASTVLLRDGCDAGGLLLLPVPLAIGAFDVRWFGPGGINVSAGLFADITGTVDGCVFVGA